MRFYSGCCLFSASQELQSQRRQLSVPLCICSRSRRSCAACAFLGTTSAGNEARDVMGILLHLHWCAWMRKTDDMKHASMPFLSAHHRGKQTATTRERSPLRWEAVS